jgi:hypothetical protein
VGTIRRETVIDRPVDVVWPVITDPTGIADWFPGVTDAKVEGNIRTITTATGIPLPEEIITNDAILHRFQYRLALPVVKHHLGTIDVIGLPDDRSLVVYSTDCEPDAMALIIGGATGNALKEMKRQLEEQEPRAEVRKD